jgi:hypothetical protein
MVRRGGDGHRAAVVSGAAYGAAGTVMVFSAAPVASR